MSNIINFFDSSKILIAPTESNMDVPKADVLWSGTYRITDGISMKPFIALAASLVVLPSRGTNITVKPTVITLTPDAGTSVGFSTTLTAITNTTEFTVASAYELTVGQLITINAEVTTITSIVDGVITVGTALSTLPAVGDIVTFSKTIVRPDVYTISFTATAAELLDATHLQFNIQDGFAQTQSILLPIPKGN